MINRELETLIHNSILPFNKDQLYNWLIDHRETLIRILSTQGDSLQRIYWDKDFPAWRKYMEDMLVSKRKKE